MPRIVSSCLVLSLVSLIGGALPSLAEPPAKPSAADHRDLSKPPIRAVTASLISSPLRWDEEGRKPVGNPLTVKFNGAVAPLALLGKEAPASTVKLNPKTPGVWRWVDSATLSFEPEAGWIPPHEYQVSFGENGFQPDCKVTFTKPDGDRTRVVLGCSFQEQSFYINPVNPALQQVVATVLFTQPVTLEEVTSHLKVVNLSGTPLFVEGGKPEVLADEKNPLRFYLRSPLIQLRDKEDLVRFEFTAGVTAKAGGDGTKEMELTKATVPSRFTGFFFRKAGTQIVTTEKEELRQLIILESQGQANSKEVVSRVGAWQLPPPAKDDKDQEIPWTKENVTAEVLAKSTKVALEYVPGDTSGKPTDTFGFRLEPREAGPLFVRVLKDTPAPGGFVTPEDFVAFVTVPEFPKEVRIMGEGGILAFNGEHKLNIESRGLENLRYTVARVPASEINHLASQTRGRFEAPQFKGGFGYEDIAQFSHTLQPIAKPNDYQNNYSLFDFTSALKREEVGPPRGLYYLIVQGVRRRTEEDGAAKPGDPDPQWIALASPPSTNDDDEDEDSESSGASDARFILITDLGLIAKRNADSTRDVFVQSFKLREPVAGVQISAVARNGETLAEAVTDAQGRASLPALDGMQREKQAVALVARKGTDLAFMAWSRSDRWVETSRFEVGGVLASKGAALNAFLFTERGIYRPGDPIQLGGIVRQRDWNGTLAGLPLEVVLTNAKEEEVGRYPIKLGVDGLFTLTLPTTETSPTGVWRVELQRPAGSKEASNEDSEEDETSLGQILVRVEEFQPDRLKMAVKFDPDRVQTWLSPEKLGVQINLQTLFGIAAADRRVTGTMRISPASPDFEQWPGWTFGLPNEKKFEPKEINLGETKTDEQGEASIALALEDHLAPLLRVNVELEGFEADGGRGVKGFLTTLVSPQPYLLGYKAEGDLEFIPREAIPPVEIMAIGPDAKPVAAPGLKRVLVETRHVSVLTKQSNGTMAYVSQKTEEELETVDGSLPASRSAVALAAKKSGSFRYEWRDPAGTVLLTIPFNIVGAGDASRNLERTSELELTLPSKEWKPGEELEVSVRAPFAGGGLITIEREKVLAARWFKSEKTSSLQHITVPEGIEGGAYVHVTFVRGLDSPEIFTNPLSTGVAPFRVVNDRRVIPVQLDVPKQVRPGERLTIGLSTPKPAHVVIWAVDEGIHRVTNYQAPVPLSKLLNKPALEVRTCQLVDLLLPEFTLLKNALATGGDGEALEPPELNAGINPFKRKRLAPVIFWSGIVESGPDRKELFYDVPDYFAGGLNVMATAVVADAVGVTKAHTIVKGPFVLTPNAPFFAAPGDEFTASVTIANQLEGAAVTDQINVSAGLEGGLEMVEKPEPKVVIAVGKEATVHFRLRAGDALGNAAIKFVASANNERVQQQSTMSIRPGAPRTTVVQSGWFNSNNHDVQVDHDFHREFSKREVVVSTTPLGLARGLAAYLREFPYGCSEQIASCAFPWLVLRDEASFGLDKTEAKKAITSAIDQLASRQGSNGGFGYWSSSDGEGFDYLSVYVTQFLVEARAAGFHVPAPMFDGAMRRIRLMADAKVTPPDTTARDPYRQTRHEACMQAAAIYLLTRNEEVTTNYALKLSDFLTAKIPGDLWARDASAVWLAATWRILKKEDEAKRLVGLHLKARTTPLTPETWSTYYESPLTREATTFAILCRHFPEIAGQFGYDELKPITELIERGDFHTLSAAWSVQGLKAYASLVKASGVKAGIAQVTPEAKALVEPQGGLSSAVVNRGTVRLSLARESDSKLGAWYQAIQTGFDHTLPKEPETRTIEVHREILDNEEQPIATAKVGDSLLIKVTIRNLGKTAQPNLALSELLPCGFDFAPQDEADALEPGLETVEGADYIDLREDRALIFFGLQENETRTFLYAVRPVCAGTAVVPASYAESMYDRTVHGHGVVGKFTVTPRE